MIWREELIINTISALPNINIKYYPILKFIYKVKQFLGLDCCKKDDLDSITTNPDAFINTDPDPFINSKEKNYETFMKIYIKKILQL